MLQKWLSDRKGVELSYNDLLHFQRVASLIPETTRLQAEIDSLVSWPFN